MGSEMCTLRVERRQAIMIHDATCHTATIPSCRLRGEIKVLRCFGSRCRLFYRCLPPRGQFEPLDVHVFAKPVPALLTMTFSAVKQPSWQPHLKRTPKEPEYCAIGQAMVFEKPDLHEFIHACSSWLACVSTSEVHPLLSRLLNREGTGRVTE